MFRTLVWIAIFYFVYRLARHYLGARSSEASRRRAQDRFPDRRGPMREEWIDRTNARDATFRDLE